MVVNGARSEEFVLANTVFQGTVLGPPLWNSFFRDVSSVIPKEYVDAKFADDLTCFKEFDKNIENEEIIADLKDCQSRVHQWGRLNQVIFDSAKEHFVVLHNLDGEGEDFRFLGTMFDTSLHMESILAQAHIEADQQTMTEIIDVAIQQWIGFNPLTKLLS